MPEGAREGILKGMYRFSKAANGKAKLKAQLLGSGTILNEVVGRGQAARELRCGGRRLERDQLQRAVSRRACRRALEHAASRREAEGAVRDAVPREHAGRHRRGLRLSEGAAGVDRPLDAASRAIARHRRLRAQRRPQGICASSSRSTHATSRSRRSPSWRQNGELDAKVVSQAIKDFGIDPEKKNPAKSRSTGDQEIRSIKVL